MYGVITKL